MGTIELKKAITQYMSTADVEVLKIVKAVFESYQHTDNADFFDELPNEIQDLLVMSQEQARVGNRIKHTEVVTRYREKYSVAE
ncbi:MAG: hypothetical protein QG594_1525 [Bacteroidota bacterium]|nr:hypothetical protein [Bacteroidota bacterium]